MIFFFFFFFCILDDNMDFIYTLIIVKFTLFTQMPIPEK